MWKQLSRSKSLIGANNIRNFLSDGYKCKAAWSARLQTPILQYMEEEKLMVSMQRKITRDGKICAVDMDILANKLNDNTRLSELTEVMHAFRLSAAAGHAFDSTSHAIIRNHLDHGDNDLESLFIVLDDRLGYGVFLDSYTTNLFLDKLLKLKDYRLAAKASTYLMLQEDFSNPISRMLSLYALVKYLANPTPFEDMFKKVDTVEVTDDSTPQKEEKPTPAKKITKRQKTEELKIRINFIRNEHFDDHFDLRDNFHLVGKTLLAIARELKGAKDVSRAIVNSINLIGYTLFENFAEGNEFITSLGQSKKLHKDAINIAQSRLSQITGRDNNEQFNAYSKAVANLAESIAEMEQTSLDETIHKMATETVAKFETTEIKEQEKVTIISLLKNWTNISITFSINV